MSIAQSLLPEFDHEMANTRKVIERIPDDKLTWKAHPKSNTIGWVGTHLAQIPQWGKELLTRESLDLAPNGEEADLVEPAATTRQMLERFDANVAATRELIGSTSDEAFLADWSLLMTGEVIFTMPRIAVLRSFILNHSIHHRGHLCVYLRLNDIPVPALYGPSGDEDA